MSYGLVNAIQTTIFWRWLNGIACNSNVFPLVGHSHDVGKHAGGGYVGSCTIALDEHGVFAVAFRGEQDDVVGAFEVVERVGDRHFTQFDTASSVGPLCHEAPAFVFAGKALAFLFKLSVELWQALPEVVERTVEEFLRDKEVALHVGCLKPVAAFACQNGELADDILSGEIDARVGLAIAQFQGLSDRLAEAHVGGKRVEHVV